MPNTSAGMAMMANTIRSDFGRLEKSEIITPFVGVAVLVVVVVVVDTSPSVLAEEVDDVFGSTMDSVLVTEELDTPSVDVTAVLASDAGKGDVAAAAVGVS